MVCELFFFFFFPSSPSPEVAARQSIPHRRAPPCDGTWSCDRKWRQDALSPLEREAVFRAEVPAGRALSPPPSPQHESRPARDWKCVRDAPSPSLTVYGIRTFKRKCPRDTVAPALCGDKFFVRQALRGDLTSRTRHSALPAGRSICTQRLSMEFKKRPEVNGWDALSPGKGLFSMASLREGLFFGII
ncbi:unnamed protein product [Lepidochelys kempii]